ncbi:hypothetical protein TrLO_g7100 [Triparma laevis f. longispina]|uniref:Piezo-type mechanosensitive ion channel component n=1 Tax=Triparma laevis f. longispina TaxID=1714387 RepID=A0A9W6ZRN5_9STRA|nr:hypothetical protein TrLO_g7100 [Triparma laevis f. longispina]
MFEYFHTASLLSLYLLSMSKVMYWKHVEGTKKVEGFRIGGIFESNRNTENIITHDLNSNNTPPITSTDPATQQQQKHPPSPFFNDSSAFSNQDLDSDSEEWDIYKTAKDIKISLGINRTTRPALNKVVKTSSYYISNFFIFCNSLLKKISTGLLHTLKSYGQILCLLTYTTLSLERPTILGFVFCFIVFCGSIFPDMVFERGTPGVLIYTMGYSMVRFGYTSMISLEPSLSLGDTGREIGLSGMEAFSYGWASASMMLLVVFTLTVLIKVNENKNKNQSEGRLSPQVEEGGEAGEGEGSSTKKKTKRRRSSIASFNKNLYHQFEARGGLRFICLFTIYYLSISISWLTLPFLFLFVVFIGLKRVSSRLWIMLILYIDLYILVQYFWRFSVLDDYREDWDLSELGLLNYNEDGTGTGRDGAFDEGSLITSLSVPFVLHVLAIRQLRVYRMESSSYKIAREEEGSFWDQHHALKLLLTIAPIIFLVLLWYSAFSTPLNATTAGYFVFLELFPCLICLNSSAPSIWYERKFKTVVKLTCLYAGCCLVIQGAFKLDSIKNWVTPLSWYSEHLGLGQEPDVSHVYVIVSCIVLELLRPWSRMLGSEVDGVTNLTPVKHSAPFAMGFSCFAAALRSVSLTGFVVLCTALILLVSKEKVRARLWRATGLLSMLFSLTGFVFQFPWADQFATPGAFWYGLKRPGSGVPDPFSGSTSSFNVEEVEPSIKGFCTCLWLAAYYGFVSRKIASSNNSNSELLKGGSQRMEKVSEGVELVEMDSGWEERKKKPEGGGSVRRRSSALKKEGGDGGDDSDDSDMTFFDAHHSHHSQSVENVDVEVDEGQKPTSNSSSSDSDRRTSINRAESVNSHFAFISRTFLQGRTLEIAILFMFIAALNHSDLLGLVYFGCAVYCFLSSRQQCKLRWIPISCIFLVGLFAQYFAILRIHPALRYDDTSHWVDFFGGTWCGMFRTYSPVTPTEYSFSNWACFCIPENSTSYLTVDFITLLVISYAYMELKNPLYDSEHATLLSNKFVRAENRTEGLDVVAFLLWIVFPYFNVVAVLFAATLVFNLLSFFYVPMVFHLVLNHVRFADLKAGQRENHFGRDYKMWKDIFLFAIFSIFVRFLYQLPYIKPNYGVDSYAVLFGLRKSHGDMSSKATPSEIIVDATIASLVAVQIWLLKRKEVDLICEVAETEECIKSENGALIITKITKKREESMEEIRSKFIRMHEFCKLVSQSREEQEEQNDWKKYLLKSRLEASLGRGRISPSVFSQQEFNSSNRNSSSGAFGGTFSGLGGAGRKKEEEEKRIKDAELEKKIELASASIAILPDLHATTGMRKRGGAEDPDIIDAEKGRVGTTTTATSLSTADQDQDRDHNYDYEDVNEKGDRKKPSEQAKKPIVRALSAVLKAKQTLKNGLKHIATDVLEHEVDEEHSGRTMVILPPKQEEEENEENFHDSSTVIEQHFSFSLAAPMLAASKNTSVAINFLSTSNPDHNVFQKTLRHLHNGAVALASVLAWIWKLIRSNSTTAVYLTMVLNHLCHPTLLNIFYPVSVFGYAMCFNPRSLPPISDLFSLFLHPLVQNPHPTFWVIVIFYSTTVIAIKLVFQFHVICMCDNEFSIAPTCPYINGTYNNFNQQCIPAYEELPYYNGEPIVYDYWIGLEKVSSVTGSSSSPATYVDMPFYPFDRPVSTDEIGKVSDATLDAGVDGAFFRSIIGDVFVIVIIMLHMHLLKMRGVFDRRVDADNVDVDGYGADVLASSLGGEKSKVNEVDTLRDELMRTGAQRTLEVEGGGDTDTYNCDNDVDLKSVTTNNVVTEGCCCRLMCCCQSKCCAASITCCAWLSKTAIDSAILLMRTLVHSGGVLLTTLRDDFVKFTTSINDDGKKKPGYDFYFHILVAQFCQFLFLTIFMQRTDALVSSLQENSINGDYVVTLFTHFCIMIIDRCIYLLKSIRGKYIMQLITLAWVLTVLHTGALMKSSLSSGRSLFVWFLLEIVYLYFSALQISYGYPPFVSSSVLTSKVHWFRGHLFTVFRAIPFVYEISLILDWACTETTLMIGDWIKLEDINSTVYLVACNLHFLEKEGRKKGEPQPLRRKWLTGVLAFILLCFIVWFPLFMFSTGSMSNSDNPVSQVKMNIGLKRYPDIYQVEYEKAVSDIYPESKWYELEATYTSISGLALTQRAEYRNELQSISMYPTSGEVWTISPPAWQTLIDDLHSSDPIEFVLSYTFLLGSTGKEVFASSVHELTASEKINFAKVLNLTITEFVVENFIPQFFRVASGGGIVTPLVSDLYASCTLSMGTLKSNTTTSNEGSEDYATDWWNVVCGSCNSENPAEECDGPSFYTISAKSTFGTYLEGYSILGLYILVIGTVAGYIRGAFVQTQVSIWMNDLPRVDVIRELLTQLYLSRLHGDLVLEEEVYREIIDIYRQPSEMFKRTGIYKHWFREDEDEDKKEGGDVGGSSGEREGGRSVTGEALLQRELEKWAI